MKEKELKELKLTKNIIIPFPNFQQNTIISPTQMNDNFEEIEHAYNNLIDNHNGALENINEMERYTNELVKKADEKIDEVDSVVANIKSDYESLERIIIDENASANLQNQINKTNSQLEHNVNEINKQFNTIENDKLDKDGIVTMANMGQDVKEAMTNGSVAVVGENTVLEVNIVNKQVTNKKIKEIALNKVTDLNEVVLDIDNFNQVGTSAIGGGVNVTQSTGSLIEITIPLTNLKDGDYVFTFDYKSKHAVSAMAGFWKVYTSSIAEESIVFSPTTSKKTFTKQFTKTSNMTKIIYVIMCSNLNVNIDFTNLTLSSLNNKTLVGIIEDLKTENDLYTLTTLEVDKTYNSETSGFGVSKFNSLIDAHNYTNGKSSYANRFLIKVHPGTYDDWGIKFAGSDGEVGEGYLGIRVNDYVYFESTDINHPENYILNWDGHAGFSEGYTMNSTQAMRRCLFHLDKRPLHTHIKGFTLRAKNTRYCIHPETAGTGWGNEWLIENCIFDWQGCPNVSGYSGATVGIGISSGESGHIKNCKWKNTGYEGIVGHNNGFAKNQWNAEKPFFVEGANLLIENCDLNNCSITQDTLKDNIDGFDLLTIKNCRNVKSVNTGLQGEASKQNWKVEIIQSEVLS